MPQTIDAIIATVLAHEGGYVDHPSDPGGATNHGVSLRYARGVGLDLDGDGDTDHDDILLVTPEVAASLYREDFLARPGIDRLPEEIQPVLVDWAINSGPPRAVMGLQQVINTLAGAPHATLPIQTLVVDGVIGPKTRRAAEAALHRIGAGALIDRIVDARIAFYHALVAARPERRVFLKGWLARAESFRSKA